MKIGSFEGTQEEYNAFCKAQPEMAEKVSLVVSTAKASRGKAKGKYSVHALLKKGKEVAISFDDKNVIVSADNINKTTYALAGGKEAYLAYVENRMEGEYGIKYFTATNGDGWSDLFVAKCLENPELAEVLKN